MKTIITLLVAIVFSVNGLAQITFQKKYQQSIANEGSYVQPTNDGGYIVTATREIYPGWGAVFLMKTDSNGDTTWTRIFVTDTAYADGGKYVQQTNDGGFITTGYGTGASSFDVYLIKTDSTGDLVWSRIFGSLVLGNLTDIGHSVQQTLDGGYIISGEKQNSGADIDVFLIKTDGNGDTLWTKSYGGPSRDYGYSVLQTIDGGFIICGSSQSFGAGAGDVYLLKTDNSGNLLWSKTFGGIYSDEGRSIVKTTDGGYVIVGASASFGVFGHTDIYLLKTDSMGNLIWSKTLSWNTSDHGYDIQETLDGGFVIAGSTFNNSSQSWDVYLIKTNNVGNVLWSKMYGGAADDYGYSVKQTPDAGFFVGAETSGLFDDLYLIKTDSLGNSGCNQSNALTTTTSTTAATIVSNPNTLVFQGSSTSIPITNRIYLGSSIDTVCFNTSIIESPKWSNNFVLFPNPATSEIRIESGAMEIESVEIYDVVGKRIFTSPLSPLSLRRGVGGEVINISSLSPGIYFVKVVTEKGTAAAKFVKAD